MGPWCSLKIEEARRALRTPQNLVILKEDCISIYQLVQKCTTELHAPSTLGEFLLQLEKDLLLNENEYLKAIVL